MAIKNYTTRVDALQTVGEIHVILAKHGAKKVMFDYDDNGRVEAVCFGIDGPHGLIGIKLPANVSRVQAVLKEQKKKNSKVDPSYEQAERCAWRIVKDWLDAQMALLETEMVDMPQVFLPYMVNNDGRTVYELYQNGQLMLEGK